MPNPHSRRRAFAISGLVILLALIVFGLCIWKAAIKWPHIPANSPRAAGYKFGLAMAPVIWTALAGIAGYAAYRLFRRSDAAANMVAGLVLLVPATMLSIGAVGYMMHTPGAKPAQRPSGADSNRLADSTRIQPPGPPAAAPTSTPRPPVPQPRAAAPGRAQDAPPPVPAQPPQSEAENPALVRTLADLSREIDSEVGGLLIQAEAVFADLQKPPRRDRTAINQRMKDLAAFGEASERLAERLRGLVDEAKRRLAAAGISEHDTMSSAIRYGMHGPMRATACDAYARLCEAGREEAQHLLDNLTKWSLDSKGEVTSKDLMVQGTARGHRMRIKMILDDKARLDKALRGE